jgi:phage terminase large subunit-like protein
LIDKKRALEPIEFIQLLKLVDDFHGQPFILQDWQHEVIWNVYGTVKDNGYRQYRYAYLEIPKKNGKSTLIAGLGLYHLVCDGPGGQIFCCAAEREQASIVFKAAIHIIEQDESLDYRQGGILKIVESQKLIINLATGTTMKVISAEANTKHGLNPTVVIFDELHAQPKRDLWDTMTFGAGSARKEPLWWVITTAGDDPDRKSIGWEVHNYAERVSNGELEDPAWYVKIYGAPEDADIYDEAVWHQANPSLGVSIDITEVRGEALAARNSEMKERLFRWLRLNQWIALKRVGWLPITLWDTTAQEWSLSELFGKRCYVGIDLSSKIDLTSLVVLFPPQDGIPDWRFVTYAWIPEDNIREREAKDHVPYERWVKQGFLFATPGNVVDYSLIRNHIEKIELQFNVERYCGDPWHLEVLKQQLGSVVQDKFVEIPQSMAGMSVGMGELERLFRAKQISHDVNPIGRWSFGNVVPATDGNENQKPMKNRSLERIDPTVALINGMAGAIRFERKQSIYEQRGVRVI